MADLIAKVDLKRKTDDELKILAYDALMEKSDAESKIEIQDPVQIERIVAANTIIDEVSVEITKRLK